MANTGTPKEKDPAETIGNSSIHYHDHAPAIRLLPYGVLQYLEEQQRLRIVSTEACYSAQQKVWIVQVERDNNNNNTTNHDTDGGAMEISLLSALWNDCLGQSQNRLVVRQWRGGCQWWNLHRNHSVATLAHAERQGYRRSREAIMTTMDEENYGYHPIVIPRILHSEMTSPETSLPVQQQQQQQQHDPDWFPWAILEYVGQDSLYFQGTLLDTTWVEGMVRVRPEFGFEESHPRWGRVPVERALDYARMILCQVIIPLHTGSNGMERMNNTYDQDAVTYQSMVVVYQHAYQDLMKHPRVAHDLSYYYYQSDEMDTDLQRRFHQILDLVQNAIQEVLPSYAKSIPTVDMVLVHMDLQPQNILFSRGGDDPPTVSRVMGVLDWEDAAMADPRFELMMLGRKVCADRDQAEAIWARYAEQTNQNLGPLLPWLQLESIHSLLTMLLQSMDMLNGGRNPWETSKDLWGKMEREVERWLRMRDETPNIIGRHHDLDQVPEIS
jgi:hypothetical protein